MAQRIIKGYTNTPTGRVHWVKEDDDGVVDFGFNTYIFIKKAINNILKK